jgi:DNA-binding response OmpR family regulator
MDRPPLKVLVAEDDEVSRKLALAALRRTEEYDVQSVGDGAGALRMLSADDPPRLALLDWMMPEMDGLEVCRRVRALEDRPYTYIIFLTARVQKDDIVRGLEAGADDYLSKPFHLQELRSRVAVGARMVALQDTLGSKVVELEEALARVKKLEGLISICMHCKRIRDEESAWHRLESYIEKHSDAVFSHALCKQCAEEHYPDLAHKLTAKT